MWRCAYKADAVYSGLAIDVQRHLLYFTDEGQGHVGELELKLELNSDLTSRVIDSTPGSRPRSVAVDSVNRLLVTFSNTTAQSNLIKGRVATPHGTEWTRPLSVLAVEYPLKTSTSMPRYTATPPQCCIFLYITLRRPISPQICPFPWGLWTLI